MFYVFIALLIVLLVFGLFSVLRARQLKEGYENPWMPDYQVWRKEYLKRYIAICVLHKYVNDLLAKAGEESLETLAKKTVPLYKTMFLLPPPENDAIKSLLLDDLLKKNIGNGKLVTCDSNNLPPDMEGFTGRISDEDLNKLLTFFAGFPGDSDVILYRSALVLRNLLKMQYQKIGSALNPNVDELKKTAAGTGTGDAAGTATAAGTTAEGFFAGLCSENMLQERQAMNEANSCMDPSQIPYDKKIKVLQNILQKYLALQASMADCMDIIGEAQIYMIKMNKIKEQGMNGTLPMPQVL